MKVAFASDHAGYELKQVIMDVMQSRGYEPVDFGTHSTESCDYADYAHPCACAVESGECNFGIAMCGSGNGISMTLNKHQGIRAALCWTPEIAALAKQHNDANILVMPAVLCRKRRRLKFWTLTWTQSSRAVVTNAALPRFPSTGNTNVEFSVMSDFVIRLENLRFYSRIGVADQERVVGNEFYVDVSVVLDGSGFVAEDLSSSISYADIYEGVEVQMGKEWHLLESVCVAMAEEIEKMSSRIKNIRIKIRKLAPPISGIQGCASVEYVHDCV